MTGLGSDGRAVTATVRYLVSGVAVLTPLAITRSTNNRGGQPGELAGILGLIAEYLDGPASIDNGLCSPLWIIPATWRVILPGGPPLNVANIDPHNPIKLVGSGGFVTCRGELSALQSGYVGAPP